MTTSADIEGRPALPVDGAAADIEAALGDGGSVVLAAPPGSGKTTRLPLLLAASAGKLQVSPAARILIVVPRRIAALSAAAFMAKELGETVGQSVGHRVRFDTSVSEQTCIELVTGGVFLRMILGDPELSDYRLVVFDEVHERSIDTDLGLALALETRGALRPDLSIMAMSATLDAGRFEDRIARAAPCRQIAVTAHVHPVETHHWPTQDNPVEAVISATLRAVEVFAGDGLVFLPGAAEIERAAAAVERQLGGVCVVHRLYGAVSSKAQQEALAPDPSGFRKLVFASAIAESSLTIDGVRFVVDSGLARKPRYDPARGLSSLVTQPASRAALDQRRGRAGRTAPGNCVRLWSRHEEGSRPAEDRPEILDADLAPLRLAMAAWGVVSREGLPFVTMPPPGAWEEAGKLLRGLGAIDAAGAITPLGQALVQHPLHPRLAAMMEMQPQSSTKRPEARDAVAWAAVLAEELRGPGPVDGRVRLRDALSTPATRKRLTALARRYGARKPEAPPPDDALARCLLSAFPDRIARYQRHADGAAFYKLALGTQAALEGTDPLANERWLLVLDAGGSRQGRPRVRLALPVDEARVLERLGHVLDTRVVERFDPALWSVERRERTMLGAIMLSERTLPRREGSDALPEALAYLKETGLTVLAGSDKAAARVLTRFEGFLQETAARSLFERAELWLPTLLDSGAPPFAAHTLQNAFFQALSWEERPAFGAEWPESFELPAGGSAPLAYEEDGSPSMRVRPQALYGLNVHPTVGRLQRAVRVELLSPADRPIQITSDLPAFWRGAWADVRKDMRARYPKHDWPEEPWRATPHRTRTRD